MLFTMIKRVAAGIMVMAAASCSETTDSSNIIYSIENNCGLDDNVLYFSMTAEKIRALDKPRFDLSADQIIAIVEKNAEEHRKQVEEAFEKRAERETRFAEDAQNFIGGRNSEDCIYVKLRIAEILYASE